MEESCRLHKFLGRPYDFQLYMARTEAALQHKEVLHVAINDPVGKTALQNISPEVTLSLAQARPIIVQGLWDQPFRVVCQKPRILIECAYA